MMTTKKRKEVHDKMEMEINVLKYGLCTIGEAEYRIDIVIREAIEGIDELGERIETVRKLKRKAWKMLLAATGL